MSTPSWTEAAPGAWRRELHRISTEDPSGARRAQARRAAQRVRLLDLQPQLGQAVFPVVFEPVHGLEGLLVRVRVGGEGTPLTPASTDRVALWVGRLVGFSEAQTRGSALWRADLRWSARGYAPDIRGRSCELAAALALLSSILGRAPATPFVASAALPSDRPPGALEGVEGVDIKTRVVQLEAPGLLDSGSVLLVARPPDAAKEPASANPTLEALFGHGWRGELLARLDGSPHALATEAYRAYESRNLRAARLKAQAALSCGATHTTRATALLVLGSDDNHQTRHTEALDKLRAAADLFARARAEGWEDQGPEPLLLEETQSVLGISLLDGGRPTEAVEHLRAALLAHRAARPPKAYDGQWRALTVRLTGGLRRALVGAGRVEEAIALQSDLLEEGVVPPEERARCWMDLAESHRVAAQPEAARAALDEARRQLKHVVEEDPRTARFVELYAGRLPGAELPAHWHPGALDWSAYPQPAETFEAVLRLSPAEIDAWLEAHAPSEAAPLVVLLIWSLFLARLMAQHERSPMGLARVLSRLRQKLPLAESSLLEDLAELERGRPERWLRRQLY